MFEDFVIVYVWYSVVRVNGSEMGKKNVDVLKKEMIKE